MYSVGTCDAFSSVRKREKQAKCNIYYEVDIFFITWYIISFIYDEQSTSIHCECAVTIEPLLGTLTKAESDLEW